MPEKDLEFAPMWTGGGSLAEKIKQASTDLEHQVTLPEGTVALYILYRSEQGEESATDLFITHADYVEKLLDLIANQAASTGEAAFVKIPHYETKRKSCGMLRAKNVLSIKVMELEAS